MLPATSLCLMDPQSWYLGSSGDPSTLLLKELDDMMHGQCSGPHLINAKWSKNAGCWSGERDGRVLLGACWGLTEMPGKHLGHCMTHNQHSINVHNRHHRFCCYMLFVKCVVVKTNWVDVCEAFISVSNLAWERGNGELLKEKNGVLKPVLSPALTQGSARTRCLMNIL